MQAIVEAVIWLLRQVQLWYTVAPNERALRYRLGRWTKITGPGPHILIPLLDTYCLISAQTQVVDMPDQVVDTIDGISMSVSGTIEYSIHDVRKALLNVQDYDESLQTFATGIIAGFVAEREYDTLDYFEMQGQIMEKLAKEAYGWGIEVEGFYLSTFARSKVLRLLMSGNE